MKISDLIAKFPTDKIKHFLASFAIAFVVAGILSLLGSGALAGYFGGLFASLAAGITKEYADLAHGGKFDWWDILADVIGTVVGCCVAIL